MTGEMLLAWTLGILSAIAPEPSAETADVRGTWRFKNDDKPVKVVVLAGSVGAWKANPYHKQLADKCENIEIKNISKVGLGAYPMKQHFKNQVVRNRALDLKAEDREHWVIVGSGVNSIGMPKSTNHYLKGIYLHAHMQGMKVVALTPTPWGDLKDKRWRGTDGLSRRKATQLVVDFVCGKLSPLEAFGDHASKRPAGVDGPWDPLEVPDVPVDLYDSELRARDAEVRDVEKMKTLLQKDSTWMRASKDLSEEQSKERLESDAALLSDLPQYFLREELRAFDHTHPNKDGHTVMANAICPKLPESWGCTCD